MLVIITVCAHAGIVNTHTGVKKAYARVGGFHLTRSLYEGSTGPYERYKVRGRIISYLAIVQGGKQLIKLSRRSQNSFFRVASVQFLIFNSLLVFQPFLVYAVFLFGPDCADALSVVIINYLKYLYDCTSGYAHDSLLTSL